MNENVISIEEAKRIIKEKLRNGDLEVSYSSFNHYNEVEENIITGKVFFSEFIKRNNNLNEAYLDAINGYAFELKETNNYNYIYNQGTWITLHQLNYGIDIPDIRNEEDLHDRLRERIEFSRDLFASEDELYQLLYLFGDIIDVYYRAVEEIDILDYIYD